MVTELARLRYQIDAVDKSLLKILGKRLELVSELGAIKSYLGIPVYIPEREESIIRSHREDAELASIPANLIEDIMRRVIRESYSNEDRQVFKKISVNLNFIAIICSSGSLGKLLAHMLRKSGYIVTSFGSKDSYRASELLRHAEMVIVCVPTCFLELAINQLPPLKNSCILVSLGSVKEYSLRVTLKAHSGPILSLNPTFDNNISSLAKQVMTYCDGRYPESYQWFLEQMKVWGLC
jgi:chorismate mutase/prephenate dehydrogenase